MWALFLALFCLAPWLIFSLWLINNETWNKTYDVELDEAPDQGLLLGPAVWGLGVVCLRASESGTLWGVGVWDLKDLELDLLEDVLCRSLRLHIGTW